MSEGSEEGKTKHYVDLAFKVLSALVIPLLGWGIKLQVDVSVQSERIATLQKQVETIHGIEVSLASIGKELAVQGEKLVSANSNLDTIRTLILRQPQVGGHP